MAGSGAASVLTGSGAAAALAVSGVTVSGFSGNICFFISAFFWSISAFSTSASRVRFTSVLMRLNSARPLPSERMSSGSLLGPRTMRATTRMTSSSVVPMPNILAYSHSMVLGGLEEMSRTTRFTPLTSLMMRPDMRARSSEGSRDQSAVMASRLSTMRSAMTCS